MNLKEIIKSTPCVYKAIFIGRRVFNRFGEKMLMGGGVKTTNKGIVLGLKKTCRGKGNRIVIGKSAVLDHAMIRIRGNNNTLTIGSNVRVGRGCSFWMDVFQPHHCAHQRFPPYL